MEWSGVEGTDRRAPIVRRLSGAAAMLLLSGRRAVRYPRVILLEVDLDFRCVQCRPIPIQVGPAAQNVLRTGDDPDASVAQLEHALEPAAARGYGWR